MQENYGSALDIRLSGSTVLSGSPSKDSVEALTILNGVEGRVRFRDRKAKSYTSDELSLYDYGGGFFRAKTRFPGLFEQSAFGGQGCAALNTYLVLTA